MEIAVITPIVLSHSEFTWIFGEKVLLYLDDAEEVQTE